MKIRVLFGCTALALAAATVTAMPTLHSTAASKPATAAQAKLPRAIHARLLSSGSGPGQNLSATASSSWQTNNTVWSEAAANGVVYVGGGFTSVRPPGDPLGTGEVTQSYLAAFNASTGALITTFNPTFTGISSSCNPSTPCGVTALAVSPDGSTLYVGGGFTGVDGSYHAYLAAFSTTTGALITTWKPSATGGVLSIAPSPDGSTIYVGGNFGKLDGVTHNRIGAITAATGSVTAYNPIVNGTVTSVAVPPDGSRVLIGGDFTTINGVTQQAIASTDPTTGASEPWAATILPNNSSCLAQVKDIVINGTVAYIASEGTGGGCFDGDFAANVSDGSLVWQNDCLGATQSLVVINNWLYKGSHAHDCAYAPGGFPQVNQGSGWVTHHLLTQSLTDGTLGHWTPNTDNTDLGPRVMATDGTHLFLGGSFLTVNGLPQQGFAIFGPGPDTAPGTPKKPTVTSTSKGVNSVTFTGVSDPDDGTLTYSIYRSGVTAPVGTLTATSWPWALPVLHFQDTGLTPGAKYTYTVTASDGSITSPKSPASASVTVSATSPTLSYQQTALNDSPSFLWPLNDTGSAAADASPNGFNGTYESGTTQGAPGPFAGSTATSFDGQSGLVSSDNQVAGPTAFSIEGWFKTTTNQGGKLIGFGSSQTGMSSNYDRHIYMMNDGQLVFGLWNNQTETIESPNVYNDGQWHYVVATLDPTAGMSLYIDGQLVGTNSNTTAQSYSGYWRVGGDNLNGWNLDPWGSNSQGTTQPASYYFNGTMADVAVYPAALSAAQVAAHYAAALNQ
ncbi:MAG: LamG-like jellyroll fold domain-containing protein [Streptosporangiaceae bacterium]